MTVTFGVITAHKFSERASDPANPGQAMPQKF